MVLWLSAHSVAIADFLDEHAVLGPFLLGNNLCDDAFDQLVRFFESARQLAHRHRLGAGKEGGFQQRAKTPLFVLGEGAREIVGFRKRVHGQLVSLDARPSGRFPSSRNRSRRLAPK